MDKPQHTCGKCGGIFNSVVARFCPYCRNPMPKWAAAVEWAIAVQCAPGSRQGGRAFWNLARFKYKQMTAASLPPSNKLEQPNGI